MSDLIHDEDLVKSHKEERPDSGVRFTVGAASRRPFKHALVFGNAADHFHNKGAAGCDGIDSACWTDESIRESAGLEPCRDDASGFGSWPAGGL
ncbi:MAG: hypothetical protein QME60_04545 [Verrucomicrobiota bacterium]|nr:hypothetical protein [Verrucomicrobiota bacterium]